MYIYIYIYIKYIHIHILYRHIYIYMFICYPMFENVRFPCLHMPRPCFLLQAKLQHVMTHRKQEHKERHMGKCDTPPRA